jgi:hypothetical protein
MDYLRYWAMHRKPFLFGAQESLHRENSYSGSFHVDDFSANDFYAGPPQREALAGLSYFLASDQQLALLNCAAQNGLSWIFAHLTHMRGMDDRATEWITTRCVESSAERILANFCRALYHTLGCDTPTARLDLASLEPEVDEAFETQRRQRIHLVWLQDRNHPQAAQVAKRLVGRHQNLSVIIGSDRSANSHVRSKLGEYAMEVDLEMLSLDDSIDFVRVGIERAGGSLAAIPDNSLVRLHEVSGGVIGRLAVAAETALALAANHQLETVTPAVVEAVSELRLRAA